MMRYFLATCLSCLLLPLMAQRSYSYITDRSFQDINDLIGYQVVPSEYEIKDVKKEKFKAGTYAFGITRSNLYVSGPTIGGVYSINNINPTEYGYQLLLMNARDPTMQGHLKIFLNGFRQIDAVVFKKGTKDKEMIFFLPELPDGLREYETKFFTDKGEMKIAAADSLWGKSVYPFLRFNRARVMQERLMYEDSTCVTFTEKVKIIEKKKKDKTAAVDTVTVAATDTVALKAAMTATDKDIKIERTYFVKVRSILHYTDGRIEDKVWDYEIEKTSLKENSSGDFDRYQIVLKTKKGEELVLGLDRNRKVSYFDYEDLRLWMRGY